MVLWPPFLDQTITFDPTSSPTASSVSQSFLTNPHLPSCAEYKWTYMCGLKFTRVDAAFTTQPVLGHLPTMLTMPGCPTRPTRILKGANEDGCGFLWTLGRSGRSAGLLYGIVRTSSSEEKNADGTHVWGDMVPPLFLDQNTTTDPTSIQTAYSSIRAFQRALTCLHWLTIR